jgi:hypothetical protein
MEIDLIVTKIDEDMTWTIPKEGSENKDRVDVIKTCMRKC